MKNNSGIFLLPVSHVFDPVNVPLFEIMDGEHSAVLYSALYLNNIEIISKLKNQNNVTLCVYKEDEKHLMPELPSAGYDIFIMDCAGIQETGKILNEKYFSRFERNIIINPLSIGFDSSVIQKTIQMLAGEDNSLVIGKSFNDQLGFIGFNEYRNELLNDAGSRDFNFDNYLPGIFKHNYFVSVLNKFMYIKDLNDFRTLYTELSKKESLNYCSQKIHELFTHLFIEYKEMLR